MWDNSDIKQKIRIRNNLYRYPINKDVCIDYFAGTGVLTDNFWSKVCKQVIAIDKESSKLDKIKALNCIKKVGDNNDFIELSENIEIIDCDAYGLVLDFIRQVLEVSKTNSKIIFFTDGFFKVQKELKRMAITFDDLISELHPTEYFYEKANGGNVYYGYLYYKNLLYEDN